MINTYHPLRSLREGHWFKLICGASFQHLPAVRNLTLAYALAGADCIDVAADPAVVTVAREALQVADQLVRMGEVVPPRFFQGLPWLMVSLNDGEDPHFRKATFDPLTCPADCPRPCEVICPAQAIVFPETELSGAGSTGVIDERCYGCGRCLPICPIQTISTRSYVCAPDVLAPQVLPLVEAVEIHTQVGRTADFARLWQAIAPWLDHLKLVAISCPDGEDLIDYLWSLQELMGSVPCALVWQTDGRPMSGDIGDGATRAAVKLGEKVLQAQLPGYVQLAGGTNRHTVAKLRSRGLLFDPQVPSAPRIAGVAYGSFARVLLASVLEQLEAVTDQAAAVVLPQAGGSCQLETVPHLLLQAVDLAYSLVAQLKLPDYQALSTHGEPQRYKPA